MLVTARVVCTLAALALVLPTLLSGAAPVDQQFWVRAHRLAQLGDIGEWPQDLYQPVVRVRGERRTFFPPADVGTRTIAADALAGAAEWAGANGSVALLVLHRGVIQHEQYWEGMSGDALFPVRAITRSLMALAYGTAVADGTVVLDAPVSAHLDEWRDDLRGRITVRQLMHNVSGLEELPINALEIPKGLAAAERLRFIEASATDKNTLLTLSNDFAAAALSFDRVHAPGTRFSFSNANSQLLGVVFERALGTDVERWFEQTFWRHVAAAEGEFYLDREGGMPAVYCCFRATPRDVLRAGALLVTDGIVDGRRVLPVGWLNEMRKTSEANSLYGLQLWSGRATAGQRQYNTNPAQGVFHSEAYATDDVIWLEGGGGRTVWAVPSEQLVIVRLGRSVPGWDASFLLNTVMRGLVEAGATGNQLGD